MVVAEVIAEDTLAVTVGQMVEAEVADIKS